MTLGLLSNSSAPTTPESDRTPIGTALRLLGWVEGKNLRIEPAYAAGDREQLAALAEALVRKKVDLIYVQGPEAAGVAARATRAIPIVFFGPTFPVEMGLVESSARPGRNVTGVAWSAGIQLYEKLLEFAKDVAPTATRVAYLRPGAPGLEPGWWTEATQRLEATAKARGLELRAFNVLGPGDFGAAFESIKAWRAQALFCHQTPMLFSARRSITDFAYSSRIPGLFDSRYFVEAGGLFSYGPDVSELFGQSVRFVDRILRGTNPADLPVEMPTRYEMFVNLKTATGLGMKFPQTLLLRADRVIE